jgi:hypothetical protein
MQRAEGEEMVWEYEIRYLSDSFISIAYTGNGRTKYMGG